VLRLTRNGAEHDIRVDLQDMKFEAVIGDRVIGMGCPPSAVGDQAIIGICQCAKLSDL